MDSNFRQYARKTGRYNEKIPLGNRMTTKEEIASMTVYLASEQASHITG
jgi:L-fucose dehydrogenase